MNFGMILLCLLIGCVIGFEFGKYIVGKKVGQMLTNVAENLKKEAAEAQKKKEDRQNKLKQFMDEAQKYLEEIKQRQKESQLNKPNQKVIDEIYEMEPRKEDMK